ncbi:hypothetical protein [Pseudomonas aeruginosa]|uniref:hypothetical protein n=1 Tax=Pseudomonas aeruginosa TaxID=287 RepID=UPI0021A70898|nr:hypothetical protein [Pseudomonas aeruginosa]UWU64933.1 hypothetical protein NDR95_13530 [Pseudomonas aeruginosa]
MSKELNKASVKQAGGDERDFQAKGAQEVPSPVSKEYDRHLISLLRKGEALPGHQEEAADEIERLRDWNDHLNNTVLPNILNPNFLMLMKGGERLLDLCTKDGKFIGVSLNDMKDVFDWMVTHARIAPDHAALAQPSPASDLDPFNLAPHAEAFNEAPDEALKPDQAEAERPEVVATMYVPNEKVHDDVGFKAFVIVGNCDKDGGEFYDPEKLMTVAQHERIVGELRTEIAMLRSYESEWELLLNQHEQERDSALAEVERLRQFERICEGLPQDAIDGCWTVQGIRGYAKLLEDQLKSALARVAELEKQEPVATVAKVPGEDWNGLHFYRDLQGMLPGTKLYTTPVAQAQHSVPDGYRLIRLEHFAAIKAQLNPEQVDAYRGRNIYDEDKVYANWNACRSALDEIKDVFQQIDWDAENELAELLAAAPGKEGV